MTDGELLTKVRLLPSRTVLALTLWGECRGESTEGQIAVACVIRNRVKKSGKSYASVCLAPWQFSCWHEQGINHALLLHVAETVLLGGMPLNDKAWINLCEIADSCVKDILPDKSQGASNYLTNTLYASKDCPAWAKHGTVTVVIGAHTFLKDC